MPVDLHAAPVRMPPLPSPPPLEHASEGQKRRIKDLERRLKQHRDKNDLEEEEYFQLYAELEQLRRDVADVPTGELVLEDGPSDGEGEAASSVVPDAKRAAASSGGASRKLAIKREIRDIEKAIKAHKKKPTLSSREMTEMAQRLAKLKQDLSSTQDRKRVMLSLQLASPCGPCSSMLAAAAASLTSAAAADGGTAAVATMALDDRLALSGLSEAQTSALFRALAPEECAEAAAEPPGGEDSDSDIWAVWRHEGLRIVALRGLEPLDLAAELAAIGEGPAPHAVVVGAASLRARGGICAVLRDFKGALIVVEEHLAEGAGASALAEVASLLHALRIKARWQVSSDAGLATPRLLQIELPKPLEGEVIGDLKWRDVKESSDLSPLLGDAEEECRAEFDEDLEEVLAADGIRMGLLVSVTGKRGEPRAFLGFITYKFWGPPLKAMSISRVAVPQRFQMQGLGRQLVRWAIEKAKSKSRYDCDRVSLSAIPKAVNFYERMNFSTLVDEDLPDDDGGPTVAESVKMEFRLGKK